MPNMKELRFPWNNWQSIVSVNNYLTPDLGPDSERWPVTKNAHFSAGRFLGAEILEKKIEAAIQNAAKRKLTRFVTPGAAGAQTVQNAPTARRCSPRRRSTFAAPPSCRGSIPCRRSTTPGRPSRSRSPRRSSSTRPR
jgi:hypothetical protein